jgi:hypothetical protein
MESVPGCHHGGYSRLDRVIVVGVILNSAGNELVICRQGNGGLAATWIASGQISRVEIRELSFIHFVVIDLMSSQFMPSTFVPL